MTLLHTQIARLLRLEAEVEPAKPPVACGMDSLAIVELRSWVRESLGAELSTLDVMNASSLVALSRTLDLGAGRATSQVRMTRRVRGTVPWINSIQIDMVKSKGKEGEAR